MNYHLNLIPGDEISKLKLKNSAKIMFSTIWGGFTNNPIYMTVPLDEHMVHRGDGVFEAIRFHKGKIYLLDSHLERLFLSAEKLKFRHVFSKKQLEEILRKGIELSELETGMIRLFLARGPGNFSPNPYDTDGAQLYIAFTDWKPYPSEKYEHGASLQITSHEYFKDHWMTQIKSCNYLPNVMLKGLAIEQNVDFVLSQSKDGFAGEGPTENFFIWDGSTIFYPLYDYTLKGTTMNRLFELVKLNNLAKIATCNLDFERILSAQACFMIGTTLGALPITSINKIKINNGQVSEFSKTLNQLLKQDWEFEG
jgi:branched-subunit amino acid aminotransferase/4-amino-4-deoxychorismate lyase